MFFSKNSSSESNNNCPHCNTNNTPNDEYPGSRNVIQEHYEYECPNCGKTAYFYNNKEE